MNFLLPGIYLGVLVSSLTGSLHCVGMCGGLMINVTKNSRENIFYHLGRLIAYVGLGCVTGFIGDEFFSSGILRSFQLLTSIVISLLFFWTAFKVWKNQAFHFEIIPSALLLKFQKWSLSRERISPAFFIGLSSGLLPCGWLHTFIIAALATRSAAQGALLLFFFWLGTVPALVASYSTIKKATLPIGRYSSKLLATLLLIAGIFTLTIKCYPLLVSQTQANDSCPFHHENQ